MLAISILLSGLAGAQEAAPYDRFHDVLALLDHPDFAHRQNAEEILVVRAPEQLLEAVQQLASNLDVSTHSRWRLGVLGRVMERGALPVEATDEDTPPAPVSRSAAIAEWIDTDPADAGQKSESMRGLLLDLEASRSYSRDSPAFVAMLDRGEEGTAELLAAIGDPSLSGTLHYYALLAYQEVASPEALIADLPDLLTRADDQLAANIGSTFRQAQASRTTKTSPEPIVALSSSTNPLTRVRAGQALSNMIYSNYGDEATYREMVTEALMTLVEDPLAEVAVAALAGVRNQGAQLASDKRVLAAARSGDVELAAAALECLRFSQQPEILELARDLCKHEQPLMRARAIGIIGAAAIPQRDRFAEIGGEALLEAGCDDPDVSVRIATYDALGSVSAATGANPAGTSGMLAWVAERLRGRLARARSEDRSPDELAAVVRALAAIPDLDSIALFSELLDSPSDSLRMNVLSSLRRLAYKAEDEQKEQIVVAFRRALAHANANTRYYAVQYLAGMDVESALEDLAELIDDDDMMIRKAVLGGLANRRGSVRAAAMLAHALEMDPEPEHRENAASYLAVVAVPGQADIAVREALAAALEDESEEVRAAAAETMHMLGIPGSETARVHNLEKQVERLASYPNLVKLRQAYSAAQRFSDALGLCEKIIQLAPPNLPRGSEQVEAARCAVHAGEQARALEFLRAASAAGWRNLLQLRTDPIFAPLAEEPGFRELLAGER